MNYNLLFEKKKNILSFIMLFKLLKFTAAVSLVFISSCTKKDQNLQTQPTAASVASKTVVVTPVGPQLSKNVLESVRFAASIEKEALKLIFKNRPLPQFLLFQYLSYILDIKSGIKRSALSGLDCNSFELKGDQYQINILKTCSRPEQEIISFKLSRDMSDVNIKFNSGYLGVILGASVALTARNIECNYRIFKEKLSQLTCENWTYQMSEDQISSSEVRAKEFRFERTAHRQLVLRGGFYKEMVENKKFEILVPLDGKIKIIEKELKVKDDFAQIIKDQDEKILKQKTAQENSSDETTSATAVVDHSKENTQEVQDAEKNKKEDPKDQISEQSQNAADTQKESGAEEGKPQGENQNVQPTETNETRRGR